MPGVAFRQNARSSLEEGGEGCEGDSSRGRMSGDAAERAGLGAALNEISTQDGNNNKWV